jgi:hypothetical protein
VWRWRLAEQRLKAGAAGQAACGQIAVLLDEASLGPGLEIGSFFSRLEAIFGDEAEAARVWKILRKGGLALFHAL